MHSGIYELAHRANEQARQRIDHRAIARRSHQVAQQQRSIDRRSIEQAGKFASDVGFDLVAMFVIVAVISVAVWMMGAPQSVSASASEYPQQMTATFTPDGVHQIEVVQPPSVVRVQVPSYLNDGNFTPDGTWTIQNASESAPRIAMFMPDGVNFVERVGEPRLARTQVLSYLNSENFTPDGVNNIQVTNEGPVQVSNLAYFYSDSQVRNTVG